MQDFEASPIRSQRPEARAERAPPVAISYSLNFREELPELSTRSLFDGDMGACFGYYARFCA